VASDYDPRFSPAYQRGHEDDAVPVVELVETSPPSTSRRNPWMPVLWLLSIFLLGFGLWAQWYSQRLFTSPNIDNVQEYYVIPSVLSSLSPWFVVVGLASLVGVVFLHAVRWRER
jgi:FtsH-binding integral membrane protein